MVSIFGSTEKPLIISHNGASGDYPDCTDLAYRKAVADGADVIDCTVQVVINAKKFLEQYKFSYLLSDRFITDSQSIINIFVYLLLSSNIIIDS